MDYLFLLFTLLGDESLFMVAIAGTLWCIDKQLGYRLGFIYLSSGAFNTALKEIFRVPRPVGQVRFQPNLLSAEGYSFPSGHAQTVASFWVGLMVCLKKRRVCFLGLLLIAGVSVSRVYLGVHTTLDVVSGIIIGAVWAIVANWIFALAEATGNKAFLLVFVAPALAAAFFFPTPTYLKVSGALLGSFTGYLIEPKYVRYEVKAPFQVQVLKFIIGAAGLFLIRIIIKALLPESIACDFFRYLLIGIWVTLAAPYLFGLVFPKECRLYSPDRRGL